jgi:hypothetical protein
VFTFHVDRVPFLQRATIGTISLFGETGEFGHFAHTKQAACPLQA